MSAPPIALRTLTSDFVNRQMRDFLTHLLGQRGREVALGGRAADGDDALAFEKRQAPSCGGNIDFDLPL